MTHQAEYIRWKESTILSDAERQELIAIAGNEEEIEDRFYRGLSFGTAGLRGVMGMGTNRMNHYVVRQASEAFARVILREDPRGKERGVCICYDCRLHSREFAAVAAHAMRRHGIKVYLFEDCRPTPQLSFAVRHFDAAAGINVTASHNPKEYNGFKVYWAGGAQLPPAQADLVAAEMEKIPVLATDGEPVGEMAPVEYLGEAFDRLYMDAVLRTAMDSAAIPAVAEDFKVVFTPFHGVGGAIVPQVLREAGIRHLYCVEAQMAPDGTFPTVESPNPEDPAGFALAAELALQVGADFIVGTDPDSDRVGIQVKDPNGKFVPVSGNRTGALLLHYILTSGARCGRLPQNPAVIKTLVTTDLARKIAEAHGAACYDTFTGFKYMAEKVKELEDADSGNYILAYEESYGYMMGDHARDKDGVVGALLLTEMAAWYRARGMTVLDGLQELWDTYGYYAEHTINAMFPGADGMERMQRIMEGLRAQPPAMIGEKPVCAVLDYRSGVRRDSEGDQPLHISGSDVLCFQLKAGGKVIVRPSGTEPKIKVYALVKGSSLAESENLAIRCAESARDLFVKI